MLNFDGWNLQANEQRRLDNLALYLRKLISPNPTQFMLTLLSGC